MWQFVVLAVCWATSADAFASAPIWWGGIPAKKFVLAPQSLTNRFFASSKSITAPQELAIWEKPGKITPSEVPYFTPRPDETIAWDATDLCLEADGDKSGDAIRMNYCTGGSNQLWSVIGLDAGRTQQIKLKGTENCIDVSRGLNGSPVALRECDGRVSEWWKIEEPIPLSAQGTSQTQALQSSLRHVLISFFSIALLGASGFSAWLLLLNRKARVAPIRQSSIPSKVEHGGVSLIQNLVMHQDGHHVSASSGMRVQQHVPAAMRSSPATMQFTIEWRDEYRAECERKEKEEAEKLAMKKEPDYIEKKIIIMVGPPGAGKGTHSPTIEKTLSIPSLSTGDMLRDAVAQQTEIGKQAKAIMESGGLVNDVIVLGIIKNRIAQPDCRLGFILDGFPRTVKQAEMLDSLLTDCGDKVRAVIEFNVPDEVLEERICGRWIHKASGRSYHVKFNPPKSLGDSTPSEDNMKDDQTGEPLMQRADDKPDALVKRLKSYHEETEPILKRYKDVATILDASQALEDVKNDVQGFLGRLIKVISIEY